MICFAEIVNGPITPALEATTLQPVHESLAAIRACGTVGASLRFEGIVRRAESSPSHQQHLRDLAAIEYQTYDPMAQRELAGLAHEVAVRRGLEAIVVLHSRGRVAPGECSFVLEVRSAHRAESLAAMTEFIDRLKRDVPIWKHLIWSDAECG